MQHANLAAEIISVLEWKQYFRASLFCAFEFLYQTFCNATYHFLLCMNLMVRYLVHLWLKEQSECIRVQARKMFLCCSIPAINKLCGGSPNPLSALRQRPWLVDVDRGGSYNCSRHACWPNLGRNMWEWGEPLLNNMPCTGLCCIHQSSKAISKKWRSATSKLPQMHLQLSR